ncbi:hypothetical protein [Labedaea rhizosphaerae]|uniref:PLL-like beta propeller domain-containing protein n=1 Tax=Labedaea rhizosphaerae TaxID=598644 RepID=A0A4V6PVV3_LABRH|nr:hypothetical protein [Labedaea rhizosphaerae]TDQ00521.1 hypothetical protein EV186_102382 [Labedaea rhizosphaerae]
MAHKSRPLLLVLATIAALVVAPVAAPQAHAASARGGPITRSEIIWRAQYWVDHQPGPYDQGAYSPGPGGDYNYRRDCSGYVSMAWHLDSNPWTGSLWDSYSFPIARADLRAGDILDSYYDHVMLFDRWLDAGGRFSYYSFGATPVKHLTANINDAYLDGHPNGDYGARRYTKVVEDSAVKPHPYGSGRVVSARSADGRLEAFAAGPDGVWHAWQTVANGNWSAWVDEGGPANAQLAVAPNADGRLELFAVNGSVLQHKWQNAPSGQWSGWAGLGTGGHRIAAGTNADGRIEVFASSDAGVFHTWQTAPNSGFAAWEGVGGPAFARLQMENAPDGRLEVFALSDTTFRHLYQTSVSGRWSAWEDFGTGGHDLAVSHNTDGRLEVFAANENGVFHKWQTSATTWSAWTGTGGGATNAELAAARSVDGRVEVFAINAATATHVWQTEVNGAWSAWETFGTGGTEIAASNNADARIEVFGTSSAGVYHKWQTGFSTWSDWAWLQSTSGPSMG